MATQELKYYAECFRTLHTAKVRGVKAPHKAVLLLAVIDGVEEGDICAPMIRLTDTLTERFNSLWCRYVGTSSIFTPDITKPYFHLQHEPFWWLVEHEEAERMMAAEECPWMAMRKVTKDLPQGSYSLNAMRRAFAYAEIDRALFQLLQDSDARAMLRVILISTYLTNQPTKAMPDISALLAALPLLLLVA